MRLKGVVDNSRGLAQLGGWVRDFDCDDPIEISIFYLDELIGFGYNNVERADIGGRFGFQITCSRDFSSECAPGVNLRVTAKRNGVCPEPLLFYEPLIKKLEARYLGFRLSNFSAPFLLEALKVASQDRSSDNSAVYQRIRDILPWLEGSKSSINNLKTGSASSFQIVPGSMSPDGVALVGYGGHMFLWNGSNNLSKQYFPSKDCDDFLHTARSWIEIFRQRKDNLSVSNVNYVQIIIPEKSSLLPENFPVSIDVPTNLLREIETIIRNDVQLIGSYVESYMLLSKNSFKDDVFRKIDTHFTTQGASIIFKAMLDKAGLIAKIPEFLNESKVLLRGGLGDRFLTTSFTEEVKLPASIHFEYLEQTLQCIENFVPLDGRHVGRRLIWKNSNAPIKMRAVAFGNSFFERGSLATGLSWWAARYFQEFHFLWEPDLNYDYVDKIRPDIVFCQTIERFLPKVPKS